MTKFLIPLFGLISPFIIWAIEQPYPYPYIVEEFWKLGIILFLLQNEKRTKIQFTIITLFAILFSLSETIFFLFNFIPNGISLVVLTRILLTTILHVSTSLLLLTFAKLNRVFLILGIILAILIHFYFNYYSQYLLQNL